MVSVPEVVACLLDNGAEVDDPGGDRCGGVTPLMDSANNGHLDVVKLLVQRGANVLQKDAKVHIVRWPQLMAENTTQSHWMYLLYKENNLYADRLVSLTSHF